MIFSRVDWMQTVSTHSMLVFDVDSTGNEYELFEHVANNIWYPAQEHGMWEAGLTAERLW